MTSTSSTKISKQIKKGLALDIDETLSWTLGWWFEEMMELFGNPENLTKKKLIKKYRYSYNVPYWQTKEGKAYIEKRRKDDRVQVELELIEKDVNIIVNQIHEIVPIAAYVTLRPPDVIEGTQEWLDMHNFPKAEIITKPNSVVYEDGNKWKANLLEKLYPDIIGIVDDNPALVTHLTDGYKGVVYLYDYHQRFNSNGLNVLPVNNWQAILKDIKNKYGHKQLSR